MVKQTYTHDVSALWLKIIPWKPWGIKWKFWCLIEKFDLKLNKLEVSNEILGSVDKTSKFAIKSWNLNETREISIVMVLGSQMYSNNYDLFSKKI